MWRVCVLNSYSFQYICIYIYIHICVYMMCTDLYVCQCHCLYVYFIHMFYKTTQTWILVVGPIHCTTWASFTLWSEVIRLTSIIIYHKPMIYEAIMYWSPRSVTPMSRTSSRAESAAGVYLGYLPVEIQGQRSPPTLRPSAFGFLGMWSSINPPEWCVYVCVCVYVWLCSPLDFCDLQCVCASKGFYGEIFFLYRSYTKFALEYTC